MSEPLPKTPLEEDVCINIFNVSAAMSGVCLTVIGLVGITKVGTLADEFLAVDALLFLIACLSSFWALRTRKTRRMYQVERFADSVFILAMVLMIVCGGFLSMAISSQ